MLSVFCYCDFLYATFATGGWVISMLDHILYVTFTAGERAISLLEHIFVRHIRSSWAGHYIVGSCFCTPHSQLVDGTFHCWIIILSAIFTAGGWVISMLDHIFDRHIHS